MLSNAYFLAKIGADTAENEQHFAEILPNFVEKSAEEAAEAAARAARLEALAAAVAENRAQTDGVFEEVAV